jgi:Nif-specific regulatory protein
MVAQAIKIHRLIEEDKRRLVDENTHSGRAARALRLLEPGRQQRPMRQVYEQVTQVADTNTTALIRGGRDGQGAIAHAIHYSSLRAEAIRKGERAALPKA